MCKSNVACAAIFKRDSKGFFKEFPSKKGTEEEFLREPKTYD